MRTKWLSLILASLLTTACAPAVFIAGAAVGGAILYDHRDQKTMIHDVQLVNRAKRLFAHAPEFHKQSDLHFASYNRTLLITGQVSSVALQRRVNLLSSRLTLAKTVYNQTRVTPRRRRNNSVKDGWITAQVKVKLLAENQLRSNDLKIVTDNNVVYLMGLTSKRQADLAAQLASNVDGVTRVVKLIEIET